MKVLIGSKNYECAKYGLLELAELQDWLKDRQEAKIIKRAKMVYGDKLPDRIYDDLNKEITIDDLGDAITSDLQSVGYLIFLTVKRSNPNIEYDEVANGLGGMEQALKILGDLSPVDKTGKKKPRAKAQVHVT